MPIMSFEEARDICRTICDTNRPLYVKLRRRAERELLEDWPEGEGMGSSDVSIATIEMVRLMDLKELA